MKRPRVDVNLEELDQIIERGTHAPLSESESEKLKSVLHALAAMLPPPRTTEKTKAVLGQPTTSAPESEPGPASEKKPGHGRNGACSYTGAQKVTVPHPQLHAGDPCPGCEKGKVYPQKEPRMLVRIVGQAPLAATVYELDRLRCNLCGEVFTAPEPEGIGPEKYDETTAAMIAWLKYGSGMPFYRLEKLEQALGIPLPASTQWEMVEEAAEVMKPARDELIRQARKAKCCTTTTPACACCAWRVSRPTTAPACSPAASCPHNKDAGSRSTSPAASTPAKICAMCSNIVPQISPGPCRCVMRCRAM